MTCSVTITTRNRAADLAATLRELGRLDPAPEEIIVCADGCTDETVGLVRSQFPRVRLLENNPALGSVGSRDRMIREATGDLILSLDDDSHPVETDFLRRIAPLFKDAANLAVAFFPQRSEEFPASMTQTDFGPNQPIGSFSNSGAMIRRESYLTLGGYPRFFFHAYEEPDFALRCWAAGLEVWRHAGGTIRHRYTTAQRNEMRTHSFHARNELWSVFLRCPFPQLLAVAMFRAVRQAGYARTRGLGWLVREPRWWASCVAGLPECLRARKVVPWSEYRRWMTLHRSSSR